MVWIVARLRAKTLPFTCFTTTALPYGYGEVRCRTDEELILPLLRVVQQK